MGLRVFYAFYAIVLRDCVMGTSTLTMQLQLALLNHCMEGDIGFSTAQHDCD